MRHFDRHGGRGFRLVDSLHAWADTRQRGWIYMIQLIIRPWKFCVLSFEAVRVVTLFVVLASILTPAAYGTLVISESLEYASGLTLKDRNGGIGWDGAWSSDSEPIITTSGLTFTDGLGNILSVAGNASRNTVESLKKGERDLASTFGGSSTTLWLSILIQGATGSSQTNVALGDKFFIGQGSNGSTNTDWTVYDQDGVKFDSNVSAGGATSFLVVRLEFNSSGSNEKAWLWIN